MAKKKYRVYKAGGAQQARVLNPTAKFLAKAQMGMQQPSPEEMQMMEQQAMQQQGQPQMSEEQMMQQQEQIEKMVIELIEDYAELTQADPKRIYQTLQETQNPQEQQAMLDQMAEVVQKANAGAADEVEAADQPMSKGGYVKNRVRQLKKAQEGMETPEELAQTPTINDTPDGRESLVSDFNQSLKSTAQNAAYKQQAEQEFDSENYQFGGGKERRQQRRTNRRLRRAFKDIPMAYGINQMGVPSSGVNVFAPAMMQMPSEKDIIKSENAENSEVTNEFNPQGVNIKGSMKYGLFGRPKKYEFEMSGLPGAFTPFMGGMFGAGAMRTGSSGYYRSGTDWQDPVKAYVKFNNEANIVTNADEEQEMRDDPSQPSSDAEVKEKLELEKRTVLSDYTVPYTREDGTTIMTNLNAPDRVSMEDALMAKAESEKLSLLEKLDLAKSQGLESVGTPTSGKYYDANNKKLWETGDNKMPAEEYEYFINNMDKVQLDRQYDFEPYKGWKTEKNETYADYIDYLKEKMEGKSGEYTSENEFVNTSDASLYNKNKYFVEQYENATEEEKAELEKRFKEARKTNKFGGEKKEFGGSVKKLKSYQDGGQPMLLSDMMMQGDAPNYEEDTSTMVTQWPSWMNPSVEEEQDFNADLTEFQNAARAKELMDSMGSLSHLGGVFKDLNVQADPEWSMTSPEQLEEQKKINEYQAPKTFDDVSEEELEEVQYDGDLDTLKQQVNDTVVKFAKSDPSVQKILEEQGVAAAIASSDIIRDTIDTEFSAAFLSAINDTVDLSALDMYNDVLGGKQIDTSMLEKYYGDTIDVHNLKASQIMEKILPIVGQELSEPYGLTDLFEALGWGAGAFAAARYAYKKFNGRIPRGSAITDFNFKIHKPLPGRGKSTVTPMFKRKGLPPGSTSRYSKSGSQIANRVSVPRSVPSSGTSSAGRKVVASAKPSRWSRFLKAAKTLGKGLGRNTPMLAPVWGLIGDEDDYKDDVFYQLYKPSTTGSVRSLQGGGSVNIDDPMYGNPDLYKFTGGGQDFMGYGGIPMAQFGFANVDEDLTDEERMSFTKTPEFAESARSMLDEDLYGGRGMAYDDMQYAASENLDYNEDKGDQVADYYDNILTDEGPAAFQNAINEGQDSYVSAIPFANNTNPFPAEIISNPQMEALQNYTAPADLREQGYLNNNLEAQQQYLAPGEQYSDVQWDDDYQYGGYLMKAQEGVSGIKNPNGPMPGFTWEQWEQLSQEEQKQAIQGTRDARNQYATQRQQVQQPVNQRGFNPFGALAGALTGMPYGMGNSRQKLFENTGGYWKQTGFPAGTIDPSNITRVHTEGKRGLFGPKGKMDIYFGGSGEAAADGVPQGSSPMGGFGMNYEDRAQRAIDRKERRDARPGERAARQEGRQLNREERQFERNRRQNIRQGRGDTGGFDRDAAMARRATAAEQAANSQQVVADPNPGYTTDKLNKFKAGDMSRGQLRKADFNKSERKQYRQGDVEGASEARKNRRRAARKQYGGYYTEGGEYDLTTEEILEIMQAGGQIEFI